MPQGDGTGPNGQGPLTGRRMGFCAGFNAPGYMNPRFGRGFRRRARNFQQIQPQLVPAENQTTEKQELKEELKLLKEDMETIEKRLKEIE